MEQQKIILLIEDNLQDEVLTIRALKKQKIKHEVIVCRDGQDAIDWLHFNGRYMDRDPSQVPHVILLDLKLPKLDGHEVLKMIRSNAKTKKFPVVVLTTSKEERDIAECYDLGANSYVRKPVDFDQFVEAIRSLGLYWLVINEAPKAS